MTGATTASGGSWSLNSERCKSGKSRQRGKKEEKEKKKTKVPVYPATKDLQLKYRKPFSPPQAPGVVEIPCAL